MRTTGCSSRSSAHLTLGRHGSRHSLVCHGRCFAEFGARTGISLLSRQQTKTSAWGIHTLPKQLLLGLPSGLPMHKFLTEAGYATHHVPYPGYDRVRTGCLGANKQEAASEDAANKAPEPEHGLNFEILRIALPMLVALATDPIAGLVDTAFIGRIGAIELAGMAIALSIFNTIAKFLNVPLVSATTTAVANAVGVAQAAARAAARAPATPLLHNGSGLGGVAHAPAGPSVHDGATPAGTMGASISIVVQPPDLAPAEQPLDDTTQSPEAVQPLEGSTPMAGLAAASPSALPDSPSAAPFVAVPSPPSSPSARASARSRVDANSQLTQPLLKTFPGIKEPPSPSGNAVASAASAALFMAASVGVIEAVAIASVGGWAVQLWGLTAGSPAHEEAVAFLCVRALTVPFTVLLLTLQGVFRGLADTSTPLKASLAANILNIMIAPVLIFWAGWGVRGAAAAQGLAQVIPTLWLLHTLSHRISIRLVGAAAVQELVALLKPSGFLLLRTLSVTATYAYATSTMAHLGATYAAAHQVAMSLWLATSLLADALAVAAQSLIARHTAEGHPKLARTVADRCVFMGGALGFMVAGLLGLVREPIIHVFTTDPHVLSILQEILPVLIFTQPITMLAFVWDGVLFGVGGFKYASYAMAACAVPALALINTGGQAASQASVILWVWAGLSVLMLLRAISIYIPYQTRLGPFAKLRVPGERPLGRLPS